jgi:hypothetical protein
MHDPSFLFHSYSHPIYAQLTSRRRDEEARKVFASSYVV